jgi:transposase InsO family protein
LPCSKKSKAVAKSKNGQHITEFNVSGKKLYLSPIIDLFNQEIISYELTERPVFNQVVMMLKKAFKKIPITLI